MPEQTSLDFTKPRGVLLRDAGIAQVIENADDDFRETIVTAFRHWIAGRSEFVFEEFREWWIKSGGEAPHSHKFWGALCRVSAVAELIEATGQYQRAKSPRTHAHPVMVWRKKL